MRYWIVLLLSTGALCAHGGDGTFPWDELKALYRETITRELKDDAPPVLEPAVTSLDDARYQLRIGANHIEGVVTIAGRLLSGSPTAIALFGPDLVLCDTAEVTGADILSREGEGGTVLLPEAGVESFRLAATFLTQATEDRGAQLLRMTIPPAVKIQVEIELEDGLRLLEAPGILDAAGIYHLPTTTMLTLRYASTRGGVQAPEVDLFTRVIVRQRDVILETSAVPAREIPPGSTMRLPEGARLAGTTLSPSEFTHAAANDYVLNTAPGSTLPFTVESAISLTEGSPLQFALPTLEGNTGQEGRFIVVEPEDGQVEVTGEGLVSHLPVAQLGEGVAAGGAASYMRISGALPITLLITRFDSAGVVDTVLDRQTLLVSFDETGRSLSTLRLELPASAGPRLVIDPVSGSEIWSLLVNATPRPVYTDANGAWVIPLEDGQPSTVELAYLREGEPVGLQGFLNVDMPRTGLAARMLHVGVELPDRVELLSVEGPVNTAAPSAENLPEELANASYVFTQPFYKGEGITIAVSYKEPVNGKN